MSDGRICISVCAKSGEEFLRLAGEAASLADIIELRFDCLDDSELKEIWKGLRGIKEHFSGKFLATYRPKGGGQGGFRNLTLEQRRVFWRDPQVGELADWADFELDIDPERELGDEISGFEKIIRSHHEFDEVPEPDALDRLVSRLSEGSRRGDYLKLAVPARDITDTIHLWNLTNSLNISGRVMIGIAMGEFGSWMRILAPAAGSLFTFASLSGGTDTAPGQYTASDLVDTFRFREIDEMTDIYGIVGYPVSHSLSPMIHNAAFESANLNSVYVPLPVRDLEGFLIRMASPVTRELDWNLSGFSVTHPYKESIIPFLDEIDDDARAIGAVNTVMVKDGKLLGYNTDSDGFISPLRNLVDELKGSNVAVIGSGGAARAAVFALKREGAFVTVITRNQPAADGLRRDFGVDTRPFPILATGFEGFDIAVNATPVGMTGEFEDQSVFDPAGMPNLQLVYDLVYNSKDTRLLREAKAAGIPTLGGLEMLIAQAVKQFEIWAGLPAPSAKMKMAVAKLV